MLVTARWPTQGGNKPKPTLSVQKATPNAIVAFCGMDEKSAIRPTVVGTPPDPDDDDDADDNEVRIAIFEPIVIVNPAPITTEVPAARRCL